MNELQLYKRLDDEGSIAAMVFSKDGLFLSIILSTGATHTISLTRELRTYILNNS